MQDQAQETSLKGKKTATLLASSSDPSGIFENKSFYAN